MQPADLAVFAAVARLGSMRAAAEALNTVQSNVTARIRALEAEIGTPLFARHSRGVVPTAAGRRLLPYVDRIAGLIDEAAAAARDDGTPHGPLVVGALETTLALRLSPRLAGFTRDCPDVDLMLRTGTTAELIERVLRRDLEAAFVCGPVDHSDLVSETMFREELVVMTAPDAPPLDAGPAPGDLRVVVLRLGCSYRQRLEEVLARRGIVGLRVQEFGTLEAIFGCVAAGLGVTLLPRALLGPVWPAERVRVHALPPADARVDTVLIRRRDGRLSSALAAFVAAMRESRPAAIAAE
ncbi:LysR family transcriptional regulator [Rhodoplanes serenus]|uniref:LysR family transcriptional regulator n=1 Tax=Rhodoplanes serenus TaxID=200615 RepID=A0A327K8P8_9BRAD|nr:LysR family transcriptional regulator [Rhodoplanes serenus]MBI5110791.1 LysR family transcriptional regulator [Rhodovulum sp.]MTW17895.1 LysR family transcriptional regulator [Rhodoplanes serenus]RAI35030.1 LysR family transcriptional regulator [Rhodoplanes serenus]